MSQHLIDPQTQSPHLEYLKTIDIQYTNADVIPFFPHSLVRSLEPIVTVTD